jgi:hypothetical protein
MPAYRGKQSSFAEPEISLRQVGETIRNYYSSICDIPRETMRVSEDVLAKIGRYRGD